MGWTQEDVQNELARQGIDVKDVNGRLLIDWRQKGLLPEVDRGRDARGRMVYAWNQPNIVEQVKTVRELFRLFGRAKRIRHVVWLLGYDVRPELVMMSMRAPIVSWWRDWSDRAATNIEQFDDLEEEKLLNHIGQLAKKVTRRRGSYSADGLSSVVTEEQALRVMSLLVDPVLPVREVINNLDVLNSARGANEMSSTNGGHDTAVSPATSSAMGARAGIRFVKVLQRHVTPLWLAGSMTDATWEEMCEARTDIGILRDIITRFMQHPGVLSRIDQLDPTFLRDLGYRALYMCGPWIVAFDIALRRAGYSHHIVGSLDALRRQLEQPEYLARVLDEADERYGRSSQSRSVEDAT